MSDKDITIGIKTTGADRTAKDIGKVDDSLENLGKTAPKAAAQMDKVADATRQMGTGKTGYGSKGNAGTAILEASRAFEDLQYGLRGVLNNIPSLVFALGGGAGVAGVISVAAVAGDLLWRKLSGGTKKAEADTRDYLEVFRELVKVYDEIGEEANTARDEAAKTAGKNLQDSLRGINADVTVTTNGNGLDGARAMATAQLDLAREKLALAEKEKALLFSSGTDAIRLSKEREATIQRIYEKEQEIAEIPRKKALQDAQAKKAGGEAILNERKKETALLEEQFHAKKVEVEALYAAVDAIGQERVNDLMKAQEAILAERQKIEDAAGSGIARSRVEAISRNSEDAIQGIEEQYKVKLGTYDEESRYRLGAAKSAESSLPELQARLEASSSAQNLAAEAMTELLRTLSNTRQTQDVDRAAAEGLKATESIGQVGADVTQAAKDAIAQITNNASGQGRSVNPQEQESINTIQGIITDATPDAQQGGQLSTVLALLNVTIAAKDAALSTGVEALLATTRALTKKYEDLSAKVADAQEKVKQLK